VLDIGGFYAGKRVLVTGASGLIGRHLVQRLTRFEARVTGVDLTRDASFNGDVWMSGDVLRFDRAALEGAGFDVVFHLAAMLGVAHSAANPRKTWRVNVSGTRRVLEVARAAGASAICTCSSSEVYGEPEVLPISEEASSAPLSVYARSKLQVEELVAEHARATGSAGVVLRPFNVYGPGQRREFVVPSFVASALSGQPPQIVGDGKQTRVFTYVSDFVEGALLAVARNPHGYAVYNIAGEEAVTIAELADLVVALAGSRARPVRVPIEETNRPEVFEVRQRIPTIAKARRELGYAPKVGLAEGLQQVIVAERRAREALAVGYGFHAAGE
jgi:nucleoside-diphosphate-sugar epimerase